MINNSIFKLPCNTAFKGNQTNKKLQPIDSDMNEKNITNKNDDAEEYTFDSTAKVLRKSDNDFHRALLRDTLIALSVMALPSAYVIATEEDPSQQYCLTEKTLSQKDLEILEKADSLAKTGKHENVLEADEFLQLLDYSKMDSIPKTAQRNIENLSRYSYIPINMKNPKSKDEILNQVKNAQYQMNHLCDCHKNNPMKSSVENYAEYVRNNVTNKEILENVDFSDLTQYQYDLSLVKGIINFSTEKIKRDDKDAKKKKEKAIADAQKLVDEIANTYKTRAKVSGNYNGDNVLSKGELASLLNTKCLEGLPEGIQFRIIAKALEDYNPRPLGHVKEENDAKQENEKVERDRENAQKRLNDWAYKAQKEFYHLIHPNEIKVIKEG